MKRIYSSEIHQYKAKYVILATLKYLLKELYRIDFLWAKLPIGTNSIEITITTTKIAAFSMKFVIYRMKALIPI